MNGNALMIHGLIARLDPAYQKRVKNDADFLREWVKKDELRTLVFALISAELTDKSND